MTDKEYHLKNIDKGQLKKLECGCEVDEDGIAWGVCEKHEREFENMALKDMNEQLEKEEKQGINEYYFIKGKFFDECKEWGDLFEDFESAKIRDEQFDEMKNNPGLKDFYRDLKKIDLIDKSTIISIIEKERNRVEKEYNYWKGAGATDINVVGLKHELDKLNWVLEQLKE